MLQARFLGDQRVRGKKSRVAVLKDLSLGLLSRYYQLMINYQLMILMVSVSEIVDLGRHFRICMTLSPGLSLFQGQWCRDLEALSWVMWLIVGT